MGVVGEGAADLWKLKSIGMTFRKPLFAATLRQFSRSSVGNPEVDSRVTKIEDETQNALKLAKVKHPARAEYHMPQRPGFGTKGKPVLLWANYFNVAASEDLLLHRYSIEVTETRSNRPPTGKKLKRVVEIFKDKHLSQHGRSIVTDFKSTLLSRIELELDEPEYLVSYRAENEDDPAPNAKSFRIRLQSIGTLSVSELMDYLTSAHASQFFGSKEEIIQALNIVVGQHPKDAGNVASVGANKHFRIDAASREKFDLGAGLSALRGFFVSVRAATARILVNVQVKHGAFFNDGPLVNLMYSFRQDNGPSKIGLGRFLKKVSVDIVHITKVNKAGVKIPRIKQIYDFAMRDDGHDQEYPPRVPAYGAGSRAVEFFLNNALNQDPKTPDGSSGKKSKGKGKGKAKEQASATTAGPSSSSSSQGRYISVFDYFRQGIHNQSKWSR